MLEAFARNGVLVTALLDPFDRVTSVREKLQKPADRVADLARIEPSTVGLGSDARALVIYLTHLRLAYEGSSGLRSSVSPLPKT